MRSRERCPRSSAEGGRHVPSTRAEPERARRRGVRWTRARASRRVVDPVRGVGRGCTAHLVGTPMPRTEAQPSDGSYVVKSASRRETGATELTKESISEYTDREGRRGVPRRAAGDRSRSWRACTPPRARCTSTANFQGLGHHANSHHNFKNLALLAVPDGGTRACPVAAWAICGSPSAGVRGPTIAKAPMAGTRRCPKPGYSRHVPPRRSWRSKKWGGAAAGRSSVLWMAATATCCAASRASS